MKQRKPIAKFKTGTCLACGRENVRISAGRCIGWPWCNKKHRADVRDGSDTKSLKSPKNSINKISDKQLTRLAKYRKSRDEYLRDNPRCEYPGCEITHVTLHHGAGRIGDLLFNKKYFKALCEEHHRFCELNPEIAKKLKLSFDRLNK